MSIFILILHKYGKFWVVHDLLKQVGLLNIDGYYDCLLGLFDKGVEEGFIKPSARNIVISATSPKELLEKMEVLVLIKFCRAQNMMF